MLFGRRILFDLFIIGFYLTGNNQNTRLIRFTSACLFLSFIIFSVCLVSYTFVPYFIKPSEVECYNPHILNPEKSFTFSCCSYLFISNLYTLDVISNRNCAHQHQRKKVVAWMVSAPSRICKMDI